MSGNQELVPHRDAMMTFIERAMADTDFDVTKLAELLRLREREEERAQRRAYAAAMTLAQSEMEPIIRDASTPNNKYARLETLDAEARPIYTRHGFNVRYGSEPSPRDGWMRITIKVSHREGFEEVNHLDCSLERDPRDGRRNAAQQVGAIVTYLRRYLLCMAFNLVTFTDDADQRSPGQREAPGADPPPHDGPQPGGGGSGKTVRSEATRLIDALGLVVTRQEYFAIIDDADNRKVLAYLKTTQMGESVERARQAAWQRSEPKAEPKPDPGASPWDNETPIEIGRTAQPGMDEPEVQFPTP